MSPANPAQPTGTMRIVPVGNAGTTDGRTTGRGRIDPTAGIEIGMSVGTIEASAATAPTGDGTTGGMIAANAMRIGRTAGIDDGMIGAMSAGTIVRIVAIAGGITIAAMTDGIDGTTAHSVGIGVGMMTVAQPWVLSGDAMSAGSGLAALGMTGGIDGAIGGGETIAAAVGTTVGIGEMIGGGVRIAGIALGVVASRS